MQCVDCEKMGLDHDEIVEMCTSSPLWTGVFLCGLSWLDNPLHLSINKWFMDRYNAGKRRFFVITPRGHLKTSYFGISFLTWRAITEPEARVLYMMASSKNAEKTLESVTNIFATKNELNPEYSQTRLLQH